MRLYAFVELYALLLRRTRVSFRLSGVASRKNPTERLLEYVYIYILELCIWCAELVDLHSKGKPTGTYNDL